MREQVRSNWAGARMSIEIYCQNCQKRYRVKAELAGKRVRCANCGNAVTVPGAAGQNGDAPPLDEQFASEIPQAPLAKKPAPPRAAPPPVPRQVVRFDPRFDPQSMTDIPAPPAPAAPKPKPAPGRAPQPAAKNDEGRELRFADDDPLFMTKPR